MPRFARRVGKFVSYYLQNPRELWRPQRDVVHATSFGARMLCSHENYIERAILQDGTFEPESTAATLRAVQPGQVAFDVGANIGYYTLLLAQCTGPSGQVHAFEPTRWAYQRCLRNLELNAAGGGGPVALHHLGLLAEARDGFEAIESRFSAKLLAKQTPEQLRFTTLDRYCAERSIARIDFLKVDVDGYDYQVMLGARQILARSRATLLCELCDTTLRQQGDSLAQYVALLRELGYESGEVLDGPFRGRRTLGDLLARAADAAAAAGSVNMLLAHGAH
jgi:FkbM family methyltransferase